ncbi:hypothetical protein YC2023_107658 [Brassica napus]
MSGMRLGVMNVFHRQGSWFETLCLLLKHVLQEPKTNKKTVGLSEVWIMSKVYVDCCDCQQMKIWMVVQYRNDLECFDLLLSTCRVFMYLDIVYRKTLQVIEEDPDIGHLDKVPFYRYRSRELPFHGPAYITRSHPCMVPRPLLINAAPGMNLRFHFAVRSALSVEVDWYILD